MFQLATSALLLLGTLYGGLPAQAGAPAEGTAVSRPEIAIPAKYTARANQPLTLEEYVRLYYYETPILAEIAKCESRFRHLGANGKVLRGEASREDVGVMQINEFYHEERAEKLGLNLHTLDGNLAYAKWLYDREGGVPWFASSKCWQKSDTLAKAETRAATN